MVVVFSSLCPKLSLIKDVGTPPIFNIVAKECRATDRERGFFIRIRLDKRDKERLIARCHVPFTCTRSAAAILGVYTPARYVPLEYFLIKARSSFDISTITGISFDFVNMVLRRWNIKKFPLM